MLRNLDSDITHEAPALAVTTRAMRGNVLLEENVEGQEEYSSDEGPNILELNRVARSATRELEKENAILQDRKRPDVIRDLEGSDMGKWMDRELFWMNLVVLPMPRWRNHVAMICGPILAHLRPILPLDNCWISNPWLGRLSRKGCR